MPDSLSATGIMKLIIAVGLDLATLVCLGLYSLEGPGIFIGEMLSYIPKTLSLLFLGDWSLSGKDKKINMGNKKVLLKLIPGLGNLPFNTINQVMALNAA